MPRLSRRALLGSCVGTVVGLSGCTDDTASGSPTRETTTVTGARSPETISTGELDLREANVTDVTFEQTGERSYRFRVTLYHDDDGEAAYADWWQVERLDGTKLGRRTLLHPHSTAPFTRSETIEIPAGVSCVVVRGHDRTHGYGGQVILVDLESGQTRVIRQGTERRSVESAECP